ARIGEPAQALELARGCAALKSEARTRGGRGVWPGRRMRRGACAAAEHERDVDGLERLGAATTDDAESAFGMVTPCRGARTPAGSRRLTCWCTADARWHFDLLDSIAKRNDEVAATPCDRTVRRGARALGTEPRGE